MRKTATETLVPVLDRLALCGLALLILAIPFEGLEPRPLLGFAVSELELVLFAALVLAGVGTVGNSRKLAWKTPLTVPATWMALAFFLSAWFSTYPGEAFRHWGRFVAGFFVYLIVVNVVRKQQWVPLLLILVCTSGLVVSLIGVLEYLQLGNLEPVLRHFKSAPFQVGGEIRASSTLQYPTIASMYLEVVFSVGVGLFLWVFSKTRSPSFIWGLIPLLLVAQAILATLTRSGLVILAFVLIIALVGWARTAGGGKQFKALLLLTGSVLALSLANLFGDPHQLLRIFQPDQSQWYRAQIRVEQLPEFETGQTSTVILSIKNIGSVPWASNQSNPYRVSYHWLDRDSDEVIPFQGLRSEFPMELPPGSEIRMPVSVKPPGKPGEYQLCFDVLREDLFWFQSQGSETKTVRTHVTGESRETVQSGENSLPEPIFSVDRLSLWYAAVLMLDDSPLLGVGLGNFKLLYGRYLGLEKWDHRIHSNNLYLEVLAGGGILAGIGLMFFCWRVASLVWSLIDSPFNSNFPIRLGLALAVLSFFVHGLVDYFLEFTPVYTLFWIILGLAYVMSRSGTIGKDESRI